MKLIRLPSTELLGPTLFHLNTLRDLVILTLDLLTLESYHVMPLGWSIPVPRLNWIRLTVPELRRLKFSVDCKFYVFAG